MGVQKGEKKWVKGQSGNPKGRPKGNHNRFTLLKDAMLNVYEKMGGEEALFQWATKNPKNRETFYKELFRLLPKDITIDVPEKTKINFQMILTGGDDNGSADQV